MYGTGRSRIRIVIIPGKAKAEVNKIKFAVIGCWHPFQWWLSVVHVIDTQTLEILYLSLGVYLSHGVQKVVHIHTHKLYAPKFKRFAFHCHYWSPDSPYSVVLWSVSWVKHIWLNQNDGGYNYTNSDTYQTKEWGLACGPWRETTSNWSIRWKSWKHTQTYSSPSEVFVKTSIDKPRIFIVWEYCVGLKRWHVPRE